MSLKKEEWFIKGDHTPLSTMVEQIKHKVVHETRKIITYNTMTEVVDSNVVQEQEILKPVDAEPYTLVLLCCSVLVYIVEIC